jgi:hypothetical protein
MGNSPRSENQKEKKHMLEIKIKAQFDGSKGTAWALALSDILCCEPGVKLLEFNIGDAPDGNGNGKHPHLPATEPASPPKFNPDNLARNNPGESRGLDDPRVVWERGLNGRMRLDVKATRINCGLTHEDLMKKSWRRGTVEYSCKRAYLSQGNNSAKRTKAATTQDILGHPVS